MAANNDELIAEVRSLTGYGTGVISADDMSNLVTVAQEEILDLQDTNTLDWYSVRSAERALFWLVALFTKVHTKEIGGAGFTVGELRQEPLPEAAQFWLDRFHSHLFKIGNNTAFGIRSVGRTDREYTGGGGSSSGVTEGIDDLLG